MKAALESAGQPIPLLSYLYSIHSCFSYFDPQRPARVLDLELEWTLISIFFQS